MTKFTLKVGESYSCVNKVHGVKKIISASFEVFDTDGELEYPDPEVVFSDEDGVRYRADGSCFILGCCLFELIECKGPLEEEPDFQLEVGKTYEHDEYSKNVTIIRQWLLETERAVFTLFMGDDGHIYWGTGFNAVFATFHKYNLTKEVI